METPVRPPGAAAQPDFPSFGSDKERTEAVTKQLHAIVDHYPYTHTADVARYFLGTTALESGDNTTAERELEVVAGIHNADLSSLAKMALATLYSNTKRTKEALELYKQLAEKPTMTVSKVAGQLKMAALYESSHQPSEARRIYEQNPGTEAGALAQSKLQELK
jgi:predicted negative regulator of RcsB-dependent stress response